MEFFIFCFIITARISSSVAEPWLPKPVMRVRFPSDAPVSMKKGRLALFGTILASVFSLSGCFFTIFSGGDEQTTITPPSIDVTTSLRLNLLGNNSKTLFPKLENSSMKNPVFEYASSNTSIATVSQDGVVTGVSVGHCNVVVTLQSNKSITKNVNIEVVSKEISHYKYTLMFYMCASDLEFYSNKTEDNKQWFFTQDIQEMLSVKNIPDEVKIIIETGGTKKWGMPSKYLEGATSISSTKLQRWEINNSTNKLKLIDTLSYNEMAKESSFADFLSWGLDDYGADQMGVILSGHGGGIAGCAYDDNYTYKYGTEDYQYTLQTYEVANAAKVALQNSSRDKFTWIGYDCCLMQCADIATINSDYFEYMVASQELENATGWNHDVYLPELVDNPEISPKDFLPKICDAFLEENHSSAEEHACVQTLSVLDLSKADALVSSFETIASRLGSGTSAVNKAKQAFRSSFTDFGDAMYGLCDFKSLLNSINTQQGIDVTAARNAVNDLVYYNKYCSKYSVVPCGLNAFFPEYLSTDKKYALQVGREDYDNANATKFSKWQSICLASNGFGW